MDDLLKASKAELPSAFAKFFKASEWPSQAKSLVSRIRLDRHFLLFFLLKMSKDKIKSNSQAAVWAKGLRWILLRGFQVLRDSQFYLDWLRRVQDLIAYFPQIVELEQESKFAPGAFAVTGCFCMVSYITRYTPLCKADDDAKEKYSQLENQIVQYVAKGQSNLIIFPFAYIASHIMELLNGPFKKPTTLSEIEEVYFRLIISFLGHTLPLVFLKSPLEISLLGLKQSNYGAILCVIPPTLLKN